MSALAEVVVHPMHKRCGLFITSKYIRPSISHLVSEIKGCPKRKGVVAKVILGHIPIPKP